MKKLLMTVMLGALSVNANAGWFSDTYHEQGYDAGVEFGFNSTPCSKGKPIGRDSLSNMDIIWQPKNSITYTIGKTLVSGEDYADFRSGFWKGEKFGKAKCDIK